MGVNGIYGLSGSGMDIESMVKVGMMSKQNEYDKMAQKFTKNEWLKADYLELSSKITTFNSSTLSQYKMSNTMNARSAESSSAAVKVTANSSAPLMSHKVEVEKLSTNAYLISTGTINRVRTGSESGSFQLKDLLFQNLTKNSDGTYQGRILSSDGTDPSRAPYFSKVYDDDAAISFTLSDGTEDEDGNLKTAEISVSFKEIAQDEGYTLNDLVSRINSESLKAGLNIKASFDTVNETFYLYNSKGGEDNKISITVGKDGWNKAGAYNADTNPNGAWYTKGQTTARFFNSLGFYQSRNGELYSPTAESDGSYKNKVDGGTAMTFTPNTKSEVSGENGIMKIDGVVYDDITDNKKTVNGITYTALNTTAPNEAATVSVSQDTEAIMEKVKSFVSEYNTLLASLYEKYDEKPNSDYKPLTQSQKDQMKDDQIEKWEEKAKAGLLYHDQTLGKIIQTMRDAVSESVSGINSKYNSIYSLGISTTGIKGQLVIDEDKLKKALAEDPDSVYNVFAKLESTTTDSGSAVYKTEKDSAGNIIKVTSESNGNGIAQRLGDIFVSATKLIKDRAGSSADITEDSDLNTLLRNLQTKMSNFKKMMNSFEDALYKKYDAMESTLASLGMQLNYVMGSSS